jgi:hypothetical protein
VSEKDKRGFLLANPPGIHDQNAALIQRLEDGYKAEVARLQAQYGTAVECAQTAIAERDALRAELEGAREFADAEWSEAERLRARVAELERESGNAVYVVSGLQSRIGALEDAQGAVLAIVDEVQAVSGNWEFLERIRAALGTEAT